MRNHTSTLCLLVGLAACQQTAPARVQAPADSAAGETAFELKGPGGAALVVPVHINGTGPYDFVLDTGATLTCVSSELAERLALPERTGSVAFGAGVGSQGQVALVRVDSLAIGAAAAYDLPACVLDLQHIADAMRIDIAGLIGLNVLREFRLTIDFERNVVRLEET